METGTGTVNRVYDDQEALMSGAMEVANRLPMVPSRCR